MAAFIGLGYFGGNMTAISTSYHLLIASTHLIVGFNIS